MKLTKEMLIDWIDRPPSNSDLDLINYIIDMQNNRDKAIEVINIEKSKMGYAKYDSCLLLIEQTLKGDSDE